MMWWGGVKKQLSSRYNLMDFSLGAGNMGDVEFWKEILHFSAMMERNSSLIFKLNREDALNGQLNLGKLKIKKKLERLFRKIDLIQNCKFFFSDLWLKFIIIFQGLPLHPYFRLKMPCTNFQFNSHFNLGKIKTIYLTFCTILPVLPEVVFVIKI